MVKKMLLLLAIVVVLAIWVKVRWLRTTVCDYPIGVTVPTVCAPQAPRRSSWPPIGDKVENVTHDAYEGMQRLGEALQR